MLIMMKLYNAVSVSYRSKRDTKALSAYMIEFSSFNTLDKTKYKGDDIFTIEIDDDTDDTSEDDTLPAVELDVIHRL